MSPEKKAEALKLAAVLYPTATPENLRVGIEALDGFLMFGDAARAIIDARRLAVEHGSAGWVPPWEEA